MIVNTIGFRAQLTDNSQEEARGMEHRRAGEVAPVNGDISATKVSHLTNVPF